MSRYSSYKGRWSTLEGYIPRSCLQGIFLPLETLAFLRFCFRTSFPNVFRLASLCAMPPCPAPAMLDVMPCPPLPQQGYVSPSPMVPALSEASFFLFAILLFSLSPQGLPLPALCLYLHSLTFFSKALPTLVCKVIPLSPYFSFFSVFQTLLHLQEPPALSTSNKSSLQTSFLSSCLPPIKHFCILCLLSLPPWAELFPLVPGVSPDLLELVGGDVLMLSRYRGILPNTRQSCVHFDTS